MAELYKVFFTGQIKPGIDQQTLVASVSERFGVPEEKARQLVEAGKEVLLKKELERNKAEQYQQLLVQMGLSVRLEAMAPESGFSSLSLAPMEGETESSTEPEIQKKVTCPKCGSDQIEGDNCLTCGIFLSKFLARQAVAQSPGVDAAGPVVRSRDEKTNPYAVPQADLVTTADEGEMTGPTTVPAGHGWGWLARGFWHFRQNPFAWIVALVVWFVIAIVVSLIPLIGSLAITLVSPVVLAGILIGVAAQDEGQDFEVGHLFAGFSNNPGQLVLTGLLYMVGFIMIGVVVAVMMGGAFAMLGGMATTQQPDPEMMAAVVGSPTFILPMLVGLALSIPLVMAYWFAPALVALEGVSAVSAMKLSFVGCLKNMLPFLLYGIIGIILFILGALPFGLGLLIIIPVFMASIYVSFRDIYYA